MSLSNEYVKLPTSEHVSLPGSPTTSLCSTVSDVLTLETESPRPSLPNFSDSEARFLDFASPASHLEDMDIADALALKLRKKLLSEITGLALRTFFLPVSAYALFFLIVYLMTSPLVFAVNPGQKTWDCTNISIFSTPLYMCKMSTTLFTSNMSYPIPPPPISETEIGREKAHVFLHFFLVLFCYDAILVLFIFRNVRGFISSKIHQGVILLQCYIGNKEYQFASNRPVGVHRYTQYSGPMRPDSRTWKPKTTFFKDDWSFLAWQLGIIDFVLVSVTSMIWAAHADGIHSGEYGLRVLSEPLYVMLGIIGMFGFVVAATDGSEELISQNLKLETSGTVFSDNRDVAWGVCEEIWMAMAMNSVKLRKLSQRERVGHPVRIV